MSSVVGTELFLQSAIRYLEVFADTEQVHVPSLFHCSNQTTGPRKAQTDTWRASISPYTRDICVTITMSNSEDDHVIPKMSLVLTVRTLLGSAAARPWRTRRRQHPRGLPCKPTALELSFQWRRKFNHMNKKPRAHRSRSQNFDSLPDNFDQRIFPHRPQRISNRSQHLSVPTSCQDITNISHVVLTHSSKGWLISSSLFMRPITNARRRRKFDAKGRKIPYNFPLPRLPFAACQ